MDWPHLRQNHESLQRPELSRLNSQQTVPNGLEAASGLHLPEMEPMRRTEARLVIPRSTIAMPRLTPPNQMPSISGMAAGAGKARTSPALAMRFLLTPTENGASFAN